MCNSLIADRPIASKRPHPIKEEVDYEVCTKIGDRCYLVMDTKLYQQNEYRVGDRNAQPACKDHPYLWRRKEV